ncbi:MAG: cysteine desulfurase family protein [Kiritimatiellae bacterium]|nr:cysteine desulfurase family protein [Kiritimatiellia bacterium]
MSSKTSIYLDSNATTCLDPAVIDAMTPYLTDHFGNPSSLHSQGTKARDAIRIARRQTATLIGAKAAEIVFTGSGSESNNMAIRGVLESNPNIRHIVTSAVEHSSVLATCEYLKGKGYEVTVLGVDSEGLLDMAALKTTLSAHASPSLVSLMWANNETGVMFPIEAIAQLSRTHDAVLHVDAVQAAGKVPINVSRVPVDLLSLSAHKLHGPKGVGALFIRTGVRCAPLVHGGGQENGLRSGTQNVAGIVGFGEAAKAAVEGPAIMLAKLAPLRDRLEQCLVDGIAGVTTTGTRSERLPNTCHLLIPNVEGDALLLRLDDAGICASAGSACAAGVMAPSHVMMAMGRKSGGSQSSARFSLSRVTTSEEIEAAAEAIVKIVTEMRA